MCIGQLFNSSVGSVGLLLNMTEYESYTVHGITISAIINFILCLVMVPHFGAAGVALSVSLSLVF
ncbi:polysaccharide biosynthesis C-terminal domain-containing protein [Salinibacter ruber]|uniref:polysaccharide biosynthesis C-terminal domain-containing protein n=1 Tax=Salinibacter ruber TaxID=146919 RepID=UPI003C6E8C97